MLRRQDHGPLLPLPAAWTPPEQMHQPTARLPDGQTVPYWTAEAVWQRLQEAARTLSIMPIQGALPGRMRSLMPNTIPSFWEAMNSMSPEEREQWIEERNRGQRARPLPAAVDRMDEALAWMAAVEPVQHRQAMWALALGMKPGRVARELGVHRETLRLWKRTVLDQIVRRLNA